MSNNHTAIIDDKSYKRNVINVDNINTRHHWVGYDVNVISDILVLNYKYNYINSVSVEKNNVLKSLFFNDSISDGSKRLSDLNYINCNNYQSYSNLVFINKDIQSINVYSLSPVNFIFVDTFVGDIKYFYKSIVGREYIQKKKFENLSNEPCGLKNITIINTKSRKIFKKKNFKLSEVPRLIRKHSPRWVVC